MGRRAVNTMTLETTANMMVADGKALLAIDESTGSCNERFAKWGHPADRGGPPQTPATDRRHGRAIQVPALEIWHGEQANVIAAQEALFHGARCNGAAHRGRWDTAVESDHEGSASPETGSLVSAGAAR